MTRGFYILGKISSFLLNGFEAIGCLLSYRPTPKEIRVERNLKYGEGSRHNYHLIYQKAPKPNRPLMIYIHGGGFISGLLRLRDGYCVEWAKKGFFVANIGYEYAPQATFPTQVRECFQAIEKVLERAKEDNVDTSQVLIAGESAGVFFSYAVAQACQDEEYFKKLGISFRYQGSFKITSVLSICGASSFEGAFDSSFPGIKIMLGSFLGKNFKELKAARESHELKNLTPTVTENIPPSVIIYATKDPLQQESFRLAEELKEKKVPYILLKAEGSIALHALAIDVTKKRSRQLIEQSAEFLRPYFTILQGGE